MTSFIQGNFFYTNSLPQPDKTKQIQICCDPSNHTEYYYQIFSRPRKFLHKHEPMRLSPSMSTPRDRAQQLQWQEQEAQEKGISSRSTNFAQKKTSDNQVYQLQSTNINRTVLPQNFR